MSDTIKVKRDGARGYHIIDKAKYDANPGAYEIYDPSAPDAKLAAKAKADADAKAADEAAKAKAAADALGKDPLDELVKWPEWRDTSGKGIAKLKAIAEAVTGRAPADKVEAVAMLDEALKARETAKLPPPLPAGNLLPPPPPV